MNAAIELAAVLDLSAVVSLHETLLDGLATPGDVTLDASAVDSITTPCVQAVLSMSLSLQESGRRLLVKEPSAAFISAFEELGLGEQFKQWSVLA